MQECRKINELQKTMCVFICLCVCVFSEVTKKKKKPNYFGIITELGYISHSIEMRDFIFTTRKKC